MNIPTETIDGEYAGEKGPLFRLALMTSFLTVITLGIYRFWGKTRIRKYIWSSVSGNGSAFEYTGTGLEKFLGFLVAIVVLAIYLGIAQMILMYFGFNLFIAEPQTQAEMISQLAALYITFFATLPLIFFAQYRARRYKLARTRWRGIRFGAEKGAWGYVGRSLLYWFLTIISLGLLMPMATFKLEKYVTDRSWYGNTPFQQDGKWTMLYAAMKHLVIGVIILIVAGVAAAVLDAPGVGIGLGILGYIWFIFGMAFYRIRSFAIMTRYKVLGEGIRFDAQPSTGHIVATVLLGSLLVGIVTGLIFALAAGVLAVTMGFAAGVGSGLGPIVFAGFLYVLGLLIAGALSLVWITQPIIDHIVTSMQVFDNGELAGIRQRATDTGADAEGFADALDIGGAI